MAYPFSVTLRLPIPNCLASPKTLAALLDSLASDLADHEAEISSREDYGFEFAFPVFHLRNGRSAYDFLEFGELSIDATTNPKLEIRFTPGLLLTWLPILFAFFVSFNIIHLGSGPVSALERFVLGAFVTGFYCVPIYLVMRLTIRRYLKSFIVALAASHAT